MADTGKVTPEERKALTNGLLKVAGKLALPLLLSGVVGGFGGSLLGSKDSATKADVQKIEDAVKDGLDTAAQQRAALELRLRLSEREADKAAVKIEAMGKRVDKLENK